MHKNSKNLQDSPSPSTLPPQLNTGEDETTSPYRNHHLNYDKAGGSGAGGGKSDEDEEKQNKLNRLQRSDLQIEEGHLDQKLEEGDLSSIRNYGSEKSMFNVSIDEPSPVEEDAQYKLMSEIVSIECVEGFRLEFCLNGGRCFLYPILNQSLSSCECAEGYVGERCEAKSFEFIPWIRPRFVLAKTIGGPFVFGLAVFDILFLLFLFCKNCYRD